VSREQLDGYGRDGYLIVRGLFDAAEIAALRRRFDGIAKGGEPIKGHWEPSPADAQSSDPLKRYPRVMHPHRFDELSKRILLDRRIYRVLRDLLGEEPIATQTMFYFKPPGARGQAFHQDNFYLQVKPGTCIAAWIAVDPAIRENGGLMVAPGTHRMEVQCPQAAEESKSFVNHLVPPPPGVTPVAAELQPGDVLFFNGSLIHGSQPNTHEKLWRRSFICHYMPKSSKQIAEWYFPLHDFDGNVVEYAKADGGGPCGDEVDFSKSEKWH
jgi:ectoine hydroxylase-related dioxygenase (phytanoyl-CoA dioxygenase family)